jgi:hypothetical protein
MNEKLYPCCDILRKRFSEGLLTFSLLPVDYVVICAGQESQRELDAKWAIAQGTEVALAL